MDNLFLAYKNAKKGKGWYKEVKEIEKNPWYYLGLLQEMMINHNYHTSKYETFMRKEGKKVREIYKLPFFPDRIAQWAILQVIEPQLLSYFTDDTYSAIPEKGIHAAFKKLRNAVDTVPEEMMYYYRYMDDICVFASNKEELHKILAIMKEYLQINLNLRIKDNYQIFPTFIRGVDFVGYRIFRTYTLLRKSTAVELKRKMTKIRTKVESGYEMNYSEWCSINSYQGWLKHCDSQRLREKYIDPLIPYADNYYNIHIKKGGKNEGSWNGKKLCAA